MNYVPNKYKNQASSYSNVVNKVNGSLNSALGEIDKVSSLLSVGKASANDLLTINVISGSEEIKGELTSIQSKLGSYESLILGKAVELDQEEKREYENYLKALELKEKEAIEQDKSIMN